MSWLQALPDGTRVIHFGSVSSTNGLAMQRAFDGERGPLWVVADEQTQGKGRSGRTWTSVPGNLYASLVAHIACPREATPQISLVAGVAVWDAVVAADGSARALPLRLKWPNDVLIGTRKAGGILVETTSPGVGEGVVVVIGVGLNLAGHPAGLAPMATDLASHGCRISPRPMLEALAQCMRSWLKRWAAGRGFDAVRLAWLERAGPIGQPLAVNSGKGVVRGTFGGLERDGALVLVRDDGSRERFTFGDVTIPAPPHNEGSS